MFVQDLFRRLTAVVVAFVLCVCAVSYAQAYPIPPRTEVLVASDGLNSSVGMTNLGYFLIAWETTPYIDPDSEELVCDLKAQRYWASGEAMWNVLMLSTQEGWPGFHHNPSAAVSPAGRVRVAWWGQGVAYALRVPAPILRWNDFNFYSPQIVPSTLAAGNQDHYPSVGASDVSLGGGFFVAGIGWTRAGCPDEGDPVGLVWTLTNQGGADGIRPCPPYPSPYCTNRVEEQWWPCVAMRPTDGYSAIAFGYDELPSQ
jgi:hypothetical protein